MASREEQLPPRARVADRRPRARLLALATVGLVVALLTLVAWSTFRRTAPPVRAVEFAAKGIRFNHTNPPIIAYVGERVEVTVRNTEELPLAHNFVVPAFGGSSGDLQPGQSTTVSFLAKRVGTFTYGCTLHPGAMDGQIIIKRR